MKEIILGVDEAGRGPLAGRVYAAGVILPSGVNFEYLNDSKKLSEKKRDFLFDIIKKDAIDFAIDYATVEEIDEHNILKATFLAMQRVAEKISADFTKILVDGNQFPFPNHSGEAIVKGDSKIQAIMAASILAKVERDRYIIEQSEKYPNYLFEKHKGYPTKVHKALIAKHGPCPIHRKTFRGVKEFITDFE